MERDVLSELKIRRSKNHDEVSTVEWEMGNLVKRREAAYTERDRIRAALKALGVEEDE